MLKLISPLFLMCLVLIACSSEPESQETPTINRAPIWRTSPTFLPMACVNTEFDYDLLAEVSDPDNDRLRFTLAKSPFADLVLTRRGILHFYPEEFLLGNYEFDITVSDGFAETTNRVSLFISECD